MFKKLLNLISFVLLVNCHSYDDITPRKPYVIRVTPRPNESAEFVQLEIVTGVPDLYTAQIMEGLISKLEIRSLSNNEKINCQASVQKNDKNQGEKILIDMKDKPSGWYSIKLAGWPTTEYHIQFEEPLLPFYDKSNNVLMFNVYKGSEVYIKDVLSDKAKRPFNLFIDTSNIARKACFKNVTLDINGKTIPVDTSSLTDNWKSFLLNFPGWEAGNDFQLTFDFSDPECNMFNKDDNGKKFSKQYRYADAYTIDENIFYWY